MSDAGPTTVLLVDDHAMVRAATPRRDRHLQHGHREPGPDKQRQREDQHVGDPQRPAQHLDLAGDRGRRPAVQVGHEKAARYCDARAERRQDRRKSNGLPEHDRGPRRPHRPRRTREQGRNGSDQQQRYEGEGQGGHAVSLPQ